MTGASVRRFWTTAGVASAADGFAIALDGRPVCTPARRPLVVPTGILAEAIAAEWDAQGETVDPRAMPMTRMANSALDKVAPQRRAVADLVAAFGETDLVCYRAEGPEELTSRQAAAWDPLLDWARDVIGAELAMTRGVMPRAQPTEATTALAAEVHRQPAFALTGLHDLVHLSGSLVIGLATLAHARPADALWEASRIDEAWQAERWGHDAEAGREAMARRGAFLDAARFADLAGRSGDG